MRPHKPKFRARQKPKPQPAPPVETLELTIDKIVTNGFGLGHVDGLTVMVPLTAPGDRVRVLTGKRNGKLVFAQLEEVLEPSPLRIVPGCKHFGECGGCNFQQMDYPQQLAAKAAIVEDCLHRIAKLDTPPGVEITGSSHPWEYRSRANWHADRNKKKLGYFYRNSNEVCDIDECPILLEPLEAKLLDLRANLPWNALWSSMTHIDGASADGEISLHSEEFADEPQEIVFTHNGIRYAYNARVFFQGNPYVTPALIDAAVDGLAGDTALDLYCGVGLFSLPLAQKFRRVIGIEGSAESIKLAKINSQRNQLPNADFYSADVGQWLADNMKRAGKAEVIVLDPPRTGLEKEVISALLALAPREIVYVSCDPATLARDLRGMFAKYELTHVSAYDMFPQTSHVETIAKLKLSDSRQIVLSAA